MTRLLKLVLLLLPFLAGWLVLVDTPFHRLSSGELTGVVRDVSRPLVSLRGLWSGSFQSNCELWFEQELSFRPAIVRTANTLNLALFDEISAHTDIPIVLGRKDTLFELNYIAEANGVLLQNGNVPRPGPYTVQEGARRVGLATRDLRARNVDFVVVFYPTKVWMEPEFVPTRFRLPGGRERAAAGYQRLLDELRHDDVPVVDGVDVLRRLHESEPQLPLYNRGGTHWTYPAACSVAEVIVEHIVEGEPGPESGAKPRLLCRLGRPTPAGGRDIDIALLSNLWDISRFRDGIPSVKPRLSGKLKGGSRSTLVVGTSFSGHLVELLEGARAIQPVTIFPYYRHPDAGRLDWQTAVLPHAVIILEQSQSSFLTANTSEFVDDLLRALGDPPTLP